MYNLTPPALNVHNEWIAEQLAKAERYHELTRGDAVATTKPAVRAAFRMPRISLVGRLFHIRLRPA